MSKVKNTVSLTRKVVPDETMKVFLNPSMALTETGSTIYLQAETKGLVTGTKKITFSACDIDPITLTKA